MTLLQRCVAISEKLAQVESIQRNAHQRAAIDKRLEEWRPCLASLETARTRLSWVGLNAQEVPAASTALSRVRSLAAEAAGLLAETSNVGALAQGDLWTRLLRTSDGATSTLNEAAQLAWSSTVSGYGVTEAPLDLRSRLPQTPSNAEAMVRYEERYAIYARLANQKSPKSADDVRALREAVGSLRETYAGLRFDVPAEVEAFFKAVNAGGAGLELLTETVRAWLHDNDQLDRYVVRSLAR